MAHRIFIDGESGTTGLQIRERLAGRADLELLSIDPALRKDPMARAEVLNAADLVILCLPDAAAIEAVSLISNEHTKVIDASTAHRVAPGWVFGFPEMSPGHRAQIARAHRVANPGCYATGAIALLRPLVLGGLLPNDWPIVVTGVSGYSGGGKQLIAEFEGPTPADTHDAYRIYGLTLQHKHLPEMTAYAGLVRAPLFTPAVGRYVQGMIVEVPLHLGALPGTPTVHELHAALAEHYRGERFVEVAGKDELAELQKAKAGALGYARALDPEGLNGTNMMRLYVFGNDETGQARLMAQLDNLGKGASGAAVQNLNLMLGLDETAGLV